MRVWIEQDLCTGCQLCEGIAPEVFAIVDGVAYVRDGDVVLTDPGGALSKAEVPDASRARVEEAAASTPGECIFTEAS